MAHIKKLHTGRWQARYRNPEDRREVARNFTTRRDAQAWLDDVTASLVRRDYADPNAGKLTVGLPADVWLEGIAALKPSTRQSYRGLLDTHVLPRWGAVELRKVTTSAIGAWVGQLSATRSASTTRKSLGVLRSILDLAVADRRLAINPAFGVAQPGLPTREMRFLTTDELDRLCDQMPSVRDLTLTLVLGWTGIRFGEAAALRRANVDVLRRRLRIERAVAEVNGTMHLGTTKTHQARTVAFPPFLSDVLGAYIGTMSPGDLLFTNGAGGFMSVTNWKRRIFDPAAKRADLAPPPLRTHDLRHTAASLAIASGATVKAVQHQLGHRSATLTLDRYGHLWPDELDALSNALERLRTPAPADSLRTVPQAAEVVPLESRR